GAVATRGDSEVSLHELLIKLSLMSGNEPAGIQQYPVHTKLRCPQAEFIHRMNVLRPDRELDTKIGWPAQSAQPFQVGRNLREHSPASQAVVFFAKPIQRNQIGDEGIAPCDLRKSVEEHAISARDRETSLRLQQRAQLPEPRVQQGLSS